MNVKSLETILAKSTDNLARVNFNNRCMTNIETSHKPFTIKSINVTYKFFRT